MRVNAGRDWAALAWPVTQRTMHTKAAAGRIVPAVMERRLGPPSVLTTRQRGFLWWAAMQRRPARPVMGRAMSTNIRPAPVPPVTRKRMCTRDKMVPIARPATLPAIGSRSVSTMIRLWRFPCGAPIARPLALRATNSRQKRSSRRRPVQIAMQPMMFIKAEMGRIAVAATPHRLGSR